MLLQPQPQSQPPADADAEPDLVESAGGDATLDDPTHALRPATSAAAPEALAGGRGAGNGHAAGNGMAKLGFLRSLSRRSDPPAGVVSRGAGLEGLAAAIQAAGKVVVGGAPRAQGSKGTKAGGAENDAAARGNADGRAAALHRRATHDPPEQVEQHHSLPMDWTLKRRVAFKSSAPFECFESTFASRPTSAHEVLRCFTSGNRRSRDPGSMYQQALLSWQFPIDPAPPQSGVQPGIRNDGIPSPRAALWRESLRDLVYAVESGQCAAFYVLPPAGSPDTFVAFFAGRGVLGRARCSATLSHTSRGMRTLMRRSYGLAFEMPLRNLTQGPLSPQGVAQAHAQGRERREGREGRESVAADGAGDAEGSDASDGEGAGEGGRALADGSSRTLAFFYGREGVHGLFDFLSTECCGRSYHRQGCDVPVLVAPAPFVNAAIRREPVQV